MSSEPLRIINVMAASLDGRIATHAHEQDAARESAGFTTPDDRAHLEHLLADADAVIVGSSSLKASGGALDIAKQDGSMPIWVVLTQTGLPVDSHFFQQTHIPRWLVSSRPIAHVPRDVTSLVYGENSAPETIIGALRKVGAQRVLLFGGSEINRLFYEANLVDELILTVCPILIGQSKAIPLIASPLTSPRHLALTASHTQGDLVFLSYSVCRS